MAKTRHTAVLIELGDGMTDDEQSSALAFLRSLTPSSRDMLHACFVMPFVLSTSSTDASLEASQLNSGAIDTMRSPLCSEAIDQLVGHIKEITRPSARSLGSGMARRLIDDINNTSRPRIASHRPDELLSTQRKAAIEEAVAKWQFPAHEFDMDELSYGALFMLEHVLQNPELESYRLPRAELMSFLLAARRQYRHQREVHYHNWRHAVDVTQSIYVFLCNVRLCPSSAGTREHQLETNSVERLLSPFDALILLVSAIGHDVGHPGVNNAFLVSSNHQLASVYNDKSVLENYHCAAYSQLLRRHWPTLSSLSQFRSTMISTILATDMQQHFEYMGQLHELKQKLQKTDADLSAWSDKDKSNARELIMALLIKAADISNVARPFNVASRWAKILMNEFARQGELESELQIPTCLFGGPPDKEDLLAAAQSQKGFINLFGFPLFKGIAEVMPNVSCTLPCLDNNKETWEQKIADEKSRREARGDGRNSPRTYGSVTATEVQEARLRKKRESEPQAVPDTVPQSLAAPDQRQAVVQSKDPPTRHPASEQRQHMQLGVAPTANDKRSSNPAVWASALQLPSGGSSRRSSKDVALNQLQELSMYAQHSLAQSGSRRGSADASWQVHQNYPSSRRGSKEESLTTILVTSQGSPASRSVPASPRLNKPTPPEKPAGSGKKQHGIIPSSGATRHAFPSSRSQATTSATASTEQPSSFAQIDLDTMPPDRPLAAGLADQSDESLIRTGDSPTDLGGFHHSSAPAALPNTPPGTHLLGTSKADSPRIVARMPSDDSATPADASKSSDPQLRQSRSRSRLRGLKFWKKRRDGTDSPSDPAPT